MQLTNSQKKALNKLKELYLDNQKDIYFKGPTGCGKTFIASHFLNFILKEQFSKNKGTIIIFATISSASLPKQLAIKLNDYKKYHNYKKYTVEHLNSPSNAKSNKSEDYRGFKCNYQNKEQKVFVLGTSSFGKTKLFTINHELTNLVQDIETHKYTLIYFRDEAHIGSNKKDNQKSNIGLGKLDGLKVRADFTFRMTATPPSVNKLNNFVEISEEDLRDDSPKYLLKQRPVNININQDTIITDKTVMESAIKQYKKSKKEYSKLKITEPINPAMLIQISNNSTLDKVKTALFEKTLKMIEKMLFENNLVYLKYLDDNKKIVGTNCPNTLKYASKNNSLIDVIIFKVGPSTGWDIPRANMLVQLRNVCSEPLNIQTLGRIKRNPYPNLEIHPITNKYYLYSNYEQKSMQHIFYQWNPDITSTVLFKGEINPNHKKIHHQNKDYSQDVIEFINSSQFNNQIKDFNIKTDLVWSSEVYNQNQKKDFIQNAIELKIYNYNIEQENTTDNKSAILNQEFENSLVKINKKICKSLDLMKYIFYKNIGKLKEIRIKNSQWIYDSRSYKLRGDAIPLKRYDIWINDKKTQNQVNLVKYKKYAYVLLSTKKDTEKYIQYLDSNPEFQFITKLINSSQFNKNYQNIRFFAKMPVFSGVYFEYLSLSSYKFTKAYIDFAIEYNDKVIMIEVKSKDNDYNKEKTKDIQTSFQAYMETKSKETNNKNLCFEFENKKIVLAMCFVDSNNNLYFRYFKNNRWTNDNSLTDFLTDIFN